MLSRWARSRQLSLDEEALLAAFSQHEATGEAGHPQDLYPAILARSMRGLGSELGAELLQVAAVAGLEVDQDLLGFLRPEPPADELVRAGLLEREGARLLFGHPLLQEAACQAGRTEMAAGRVVCWAMSSSEATVGAGFVDRVVRWEAVFGPSLVMT